jgi:hypothetical protein
MAPHEPKEGEPAGQVAAVAKMTSGRVEDVDNTVAQSTLAGDARSTSPAKPETRTIMDSPQIAVATHLTETLSETWIVNPIRTDRPVRFSLIDALLKHYALP